MKLPWLTDGGGVTARRGSDVVPDESAAWAPYSVVRSVVVVGRPVGLG